ncbi:MAG: non-heme iron oxygenase ferredoxin subunit [Rubrivivax sp.]|nr:non-heme iron oxygenase ferredoxin subunit [Rubrivivax sp.]MDP3222604.1 non-heme iron oxygenase ferredoxin subunit [Rubrivivax sp.]
MSADTWIDVAAAADVPDGDVVAAHVQGREIALVRLGEELHAIDATCTHGSASLCGGFVEEDGSIECPLHQGRFDVRSGRALCAPLTQDLAVHAVRVDDAGRLWVKLAVG